MFYILSLIFTTVWHIQESRFYKVYHEKLLSHFLPLSVSSSALQRSLLSLLDSSFHINICIVEWVLFTYFLWISVFEILYWLPTVEEEIPPAAAPSHSHSCISPPIVISRVFGLTNQYSLFSSSGLRKCCFYLSTWVCCAHLYFAVVLRIFCLLLRLCSPGFSTSFSSWSLTWYLCTVLSFSPIVIHGLLL